MAHLNWISLACCVVLVVACSRNRDSGNSSHSEAVDVAPASRPAWLSNIEPQMTQQSVASPQDESFARVSFVSGSIARACTSEDCKLDTSYVRLQQKGDRLSFLPHCSVREAWRGLSTVADRKWHVEKSVAGAGTTRLRDEHGVELEVRIAGRVPNGRATSEVREEWRYSRAVAVAFAASAGFNVSMSGREVCSEGATLAVCEAALATEGNPLAALWPQVSCDDTRIPTRDCIRLAVLHPVLVGSFGNYCGRIHPAPLPASDALRKHLTELRHQGVNVTEVLLGAAWTVGRHHLPQVEVERLVTTIEASGAAPAVTARLRAVRDSAREDWANRFRAAVILLRLDGKRTEESELLRLFHNYVPPCDASVEVCGTEEQAVQRDLSCVRHVLGVGDWLCAFG